MNYFGENTIPTSGMSGPFKSLMAQGKDVTVTLRSVGDKDSPAVAVKLKKDKMFPLHVYEVVSWSSLGHGTAPFLHGYY